MDWQQALSVPRLIRNLEAHQRAAPSTRNTSRIVRVEGSMEALDRAARMSIAECSIAEHDLRTCEEDADAIRDRTDAYKAVLQDMNLAMNNSVACRSYAVAVNQVVNRLELETIARELEQGVAQRRAALVALQRSLAAGSAGTSAGAAAAAEYARCTRDLARLRGEHHNVHSLEVKQMILEPLEVPGVGRESPREAVRRAQNIERRDKVKHALLSRAECMKKKRAELMAAAGAPPGSRASKAELCDVIVAQPVDVPPREEGGHDEGDQARGGIVHDEVVGDIKVVVMPAPSASGAHAAGGRKARANRKAPAEEPAKEPAQ